MKKRMIVTGIMALLAVIVLQGCSSDEGPIAPAVETAPELPAVSTMKMNISFFEAADVPPQAVQGGLINVDPVVLAAGERRLNFINAAVRVLFLDVVVYSVLIEPVAAFALAANSFPQPQPDGSWLWTYIVKEGELEYSIFLYGKDLGDVVSWRMEVSSNDPAQPFDHFVWFAGEVSEDESGGYWQFYEPIEGAAVHVAATYDTPGETVIRIDWSNTTDTNELVFTVNKPGDPAEGSTLTFYESVDHCSVEFINTEEQNTGAILWRPDGSGHIEWPDYRDGERGCWNGAQYDVDCGI